MVMGRCVVPVAWNSRRRSRSPLHSQRMTQWLHGFLALSAEALDRRRALGRSPECRVLPKKGSELPFSLPEEAKTRQDLRERERERCIGASRDTVTFLVGINSTQSSQSKANPHTFERRQKINDTTAMDKICFSKQRRSKHAAHKNKNLSGFQMSSFPCSPSANYSPTDNCCRFAFAKSISLTLSISKLNVFCSWNL